MKPKKESKKKLLELKKVSISSDTGAKIIKSLSLTIYENELHVLLGPNGNGKSTLLHAIMGDPQYIVTGGQIKYLDNEITTMPVYKRALAGIFLSFQNPIAVDGVVNLDFLKSFLKINNQQKEKLSLFNFYSAVNSAARNLKLPENFYTRYLNDGFSGGEKKQYELLQLKLSNCKLALLDELDSGLDVDAQREVDKIIAQLQKTNRISGIIVSHYKQMCDNLDITAFHIIINGKIIESGGAELLEKVQHEGYDWCYRKFNLKKRKQETKLLESCAAAPGVKNLN